MSETGSTPSDRDVTHHRSPNHARNRLIAVGTAAVLLLVAVAGGTAWWMYTRDPVSSQATTPAAETDTFVSQCSDITLRVKSAPEFSPVIEAAAQKIAEASGAGCSAIEVIAEEPDNTSNSQPEERPDVWIPSSSAWLRIGETKGAYEAKGTPLARTPIVLAAPAAIHDQYATGDETGWARLVDGVTSQKIPAVTMADPQSSTVGMLSVYAVNEAMAKVNDDPSVARTKALTLRSRALDATADPESLIGQISAEWNTGKVISGIGVFPATEQQIKAYQAGGHTVQLQMAYPTDAVIDADYPFAVLKNTKQRQAAEQLRAAIDPSVVAKAGFRTAASERATPVPADAGKLLNPAKLWSNYRSLASQVLLLIDASGSMNERVTDVLGRANTRAGLLRESGQVAAQLFDDDTSIGMWLFGEPTPTSPPHSEAVPFGPITDKIAGVTRRAALTSAMAAYRATGGAATPLYRTVLDATTVMRDRVRTGAASMIVLLTDGDDDESRFAMPEAKFLAGLKSQHDPARPVRIIAVGYGPDANMASLRAMARSTGGTAVAAADPAALSSAMAKAFLTAHAAA